MRVSLVIDDDMVSVDGVGHKVDLAELRLGTDLHAVQWYGDRGEEEHKQSPYKEITDFAPYEKYVEAWHTEDAKVKVATNLIERQHLEAEEKTKEGLAKREAWDKIPRNIQQTIMDKAAAETERKKQEAWDKLTPEQQRDLLNQFGY